MVYLCTDLIAALGAVVQTTRVGTAWSKISGLQPELVYLARAQVIVGSNPTRPTIDVNLAEFSIFFLKVRWMRAPSPPALCYYLEVRSLAQGPRNMKLTAD